MSLLARVREARAKLSAGGGGSSSDVGGASSSGVVDAGDLGPRGLPILCDGDETGNEGATSEQGGACSSDEESVLSTASRAVHPRKKQRHGFLLRRHLSDPIPSAEWLNPPVWQGYCVLLVRLVPVFRDQCHTMLFNNSASALNWAFRGPRGPPCHVSNFHTYEAIAGAPGRPRLFASSVCQVPIGSRHCIVALPRRFLGICWPRVV
jgi:hypothetical protein